MKKPGFVKRSDFEAHLRKDWRRVHDIYPNVRGIAGRIGPKGSMGYDGDEGAEGAEGAEGPYGVFGCFVKAYRNTTQSITNSPTPTKVLWNAEQWDLGGDFDADGVDSELTAPTTGKYSVLALVTIANMQQLTRFYLYIYVEGGPVAEVRTRQTQGTTGSLTLIIQTDLLLTIGDKVDIRVSQTDSGSRDLIALSLYNFVCIHNWTAVGDPQIHASSHHVEGGDLVNHDSLTGFAAAEHKSLPNTIAEVLSNHTKAVHDALLITVLGSEALAKDHGAAATDMLVNVCYGTGSPPSAGGTTIGTVWLKYT